MSEQGSITVNVLAISALASALMLAMMTREDASLSRSGLYAQGARVEAVLSGAELSAVAALARDTAASPDLDHRGEAWTAIEEDGAQIEFGRFWLRIEDAQGRFNINRLTRGALSDRQVFARLAVSAGLDEAARDAVLAYMAVIGPVERVEALAAAGLSRRELARLEPLVTALPDRAGVSLNAAPEPVLAALFSNEIDARTLAARRARGEPITPERLRAMRLAVPPGASFSAQWFEVSARVSAGGVERAQVSVLYREVRAGRPAVRIVSRRPAALDQGA